MVWYFPISLEFLFDLYSTQQFNNGIRITPGLEYQFEAERWKIQFDLSYQYADKAEIGNFRKGPLFTG